MRRRRAEDRASCAILGCEPVHLGLEEAIYRRTADGKPVVSAASEVFDGGPEAEPEVVAAVARAVRELLEPHLDAALLVPAGRGRHRDHLIVREAVESLADAPLLGYYEDQPYGWMGGPEGPPLPAGYERETWPLEPPAWEAKLRSLACHASQIGMRWDGEWREEFAAEHAHADGVPIEIRWRAPHMAVAERRRCRMSPSAPVVPTGTLRISTWTCSSSA